jgi:DNA-binding NarL/FixJ family response regulator
MTKILVLDDCRMMREYLQRALERAGFEVQTWLPLSALEIKDRVLASAPDLVLSDYQMPGCNGSTVARQVRAAVPGLPVLVLTSFRDAAMESSLLKLGVRQVLAKPVKPDALALAIRGALACGEATA